MKSNFLKYTLTALSISCALFGFADADMDMESNHAEVSSGQNEKIITPNASPVVQHGFDVFVTADFIYWTGRLENIDYAQTGVSRASDTESSLDLLNKQGTQVTPQHKMSPGFKAGIGLDLKHDGWDTYAQYTYFHTSATSQNTFDDHAASLSEFSDRFIFDTSTTSIKSGSSAWHLHFNNIDWELGRNYYISPKLLLRPFTGLKGTWQSQSFDVLYSNLSDLQTDGTHQKTFNQSSIGNYSISNKENFWGVGIRTGLNTSWQFCKNWSLFSDTALSALWGQFTVSRIDTGSQDVGDSANIITIKEVNITATNLERRIHTLRPVMEFDIGIRWDYWFLDDDYRIRIQAAWEEQIWFDQNQFLELHHTNRYGCLNLQGLTVEFRLDF